MDGSSPVRVAVTSRKIITSFLTHFLASKNPPQDPPAARSSSSTGTCCGSKSKMASLSFYDPQNVPWQALRIHHWIMNMTSPSTRTIIASSYVLYVRCIVQCISFLLRRLLGLFRSWLQSNARSLATKVPQSTNEDWFRVIYPNFRKRGQRKLHTKYATCSLNGQKAASHTVFQSKQHCLNIKTS